MNMSNISNNPMVSIQKSSYQNIDMKSLLKPIGTLHKFVHKGDRVLLKTNILNATEPEKAVVTNPLLLAHVAEQIFRLDAIPLIGDSPSGSFSKRRLEKVYKKTGLTNLSKEYGIELNYDTSYKKIIIPNGKKLKQSRISNFVLNADKIIALPKIKTHSLMIMTLATKIMFGAVPGLTKARYHSKYIKKSHFADMLLDVLSVTTPDLFIMDGIIGMQGDGPMNGTPVDLDVLLASDHAIALDLAVCNILNIEPMGIPTLKQARIRELWPEKISYPLLSPDEVKITDFILPSTAGYLLKGDKKPKKHPVIKTNCIACGDCVRICPKKAISIKDRIANINYSKCIKCFCCHEVCTHDAIILDNI